MRAKKTLIKDMKTLINYLINFQKKSSNFFGLLTMHKCKIISKAIEGEGS